MARDGMWCKRTEGAVFAYPREEKALGRTYLCLRVPPGKVQRSQRQTSFRDAQKKH